MELETVLLDVESTKFSRTVNAVANLDFIQLMEFVESAHGMKFTIKVLEFVEFLVTQEESLTSVRKLVSVFLNTSRWLMELASDAFLTQLMTK